MRIEKNTIFVVGFLLVQFICVGLISVSVWPSSMIWPIFAVFCGYVVYAKPIDATALVIASLPFYIILPNQFSTMLPEWRILYFLLALVWGIKNYELFLNPKQLLSKLHKWDWWVMALVGLSAISLIVARFPVHGIKQILFFVNIYAVYLVLINVLKTKEDIRKIIKYSLVSCVLIVVLGFVQFGLSLFYEQYYFWQYWALMVSKTYYGLPLANVLTYSNSWFSVVGGHKVLRMFSILPDSHSFGMVASYAMFFGLSLLNLNTKIFVNVKERVFSRNGLIWTIVVLSGLSVIFSGTRGLWVGMLPSLVVSGFLYWRKFAKSVMKKIFFAQLIVIILFVASPIIDQGLNTIRFGMFDDSTIDRVKTIYDLDEQSNAGRIDIWQDSLKYSLSHPIGTGYGNFIVSLVDDIPSDASFESVASIKNEKYNLPQKFITAHSLYLNLMVELGMLGLLIFILACLVFVKQVYTWVKQNQKLTFESLTVVSMSTLILWTLAYGLFDLTILNDRVLVLFFVALAVVGAVMKLPKQNKV